MAPKPRKPQALRFTPESIRGLLNVRVGTWPPKPRDPAKPCKWNTRRLVNTEKAWPYLRCPRYCHSVPQGGWQFSDWDCYERVSGKGWQPRIRAGDVVYINEPVAFCFWRDMHVAGPDGLVEHTKPCATFRHPSEPHPFHMLHEPTDRLHERVPFLPPERHVKTPEPGPWPGRTLPIEWARPARFEVMDVRPERLQDITDRDVAAEGYHLPTHFGQSTHEWFYDQWNAINRKRGTRWADNPWVAAYKLKRIA